MLVISSTQITQLVNRKSESSSPVHNGRHSQSSDVDDVSSLVQSAVSEFIRAGEKVGTDYPSIQQQMLEACKQAYDACRYNTRVVLHWLLLHVI